MTIQHWKKKTDNKFLCLVKRPATDMRYHDPQDGNWKPLQPTRWELWTVIADTLEDAFATARYHFYMSKDNEILISTQPYNHATARKPILLEKA